MKKLTFAALAVSSLILTPLSAYASEESEEIEKQCRQAAMDEGIAAEEIADYIADCVAKNQEEEAGEGSEEEESEDE